jgi:hypothetical protein
MRLQAVLLAVGVVLGGASVFADPPDSEVNPVDGSIESVDSTWKDSAWSIRYSLDEGQGQPIEVEMITDSAETDLGPRIAINSEGDSGIVWYRDGEVDEVYFTARDLATREWSTLQRVSESDESSRNPEIVCNGAAYWLGFEVDAAGGQISIVVGSILDSSEPMPTRTLVHTTGYGGDRDLLMHSLSGHVWVTWIDSGQVVGWSAYDSATEAWSDPEFVSYAQTSVAVARTQIRNALLAP